MLNYLKGFLGLKKELSDKELLELWNKSEHTVKEYDKYILKIKNKSDTMILHEISKIKFQSFSDLKEFLSLNKDNKNQSISMSASKYKKRLHYLIEQMNFINELHNNGIVKEDELLSYVFESKYELFSYLLKEYNKSQNENLKDLLYKTYFKKDSYLLLLEYFLNKGNNSVDEITFLLPSKTNVNIINENESIPRSTVLSSLFTNKEENDNINEYWLFLIVFFYHKENIIKTMNKFYPKDNFTKIETLLSLYDVTLSVANNNITINDFIKDINKCEKYYKNMSLIDSAENFNQTIERIISLSKNSYSTFPKIRYLPLFILKYLLISKAKIEYIVIVSKKISTIEQYNKEAVQNFILKFLFENYSDNIVSIIQMDKIISQLTEINVVSVPQLKEELERVIDFLVILDNAKVQYSINDFMKNHINVNKFKQKCIIDYLYSKANNFKFDKFDFIDTNIQEILSLINFYNYNNEDKKNMGFFITELFSKYKEFAINILNVMMNNKTLVLSPEEEVELINRFLQNPVNLKSYSTIENFINEFSNRVDSSMIIELDNLLTYLNIQKVFESYQISSEYLEDVNYKNYLDNIDQLLEIFMIKGVQIDQITSIESFLKKRPSQDIQKILKLKDNDFLYHLFVFFFKYKREKLFTEILIILNKNNEKDLLLKAINTLYISFFNKNDEQFKSFIEENNLKIFMLENSTYYFSSLTNISDSKEGKKYSRYPLVLDSENTDLISTFVILQSDIEKYKDDKKYSKNIEILNEFKKIENRTLSDLFVLYDKKNNDVNEGVNFKHSLHPKLIGLLTQKKLLNFVKDIKINFESKLKIYSFIIKKNICSYEDIIEFESISFKQSKEISKIVDDLKILFNLYTEANHSLIQKVIPQQFLSEIVSNETVTKDVIYGLIDFNLGNLKRLTYNNVLFLISFFSFSVHLDDKDKMFLSLLSKMSPKIMILPFISNFLVQLYPNYKNIIDRYYNDCSILNGNSKYFLKLCQYPLVKYQTYEIYKSITMNNWANFKKLFEIKHYDNISNNILFIFVHKLCFSYMSMSSVIEAQMEMGCDSIIRMILLFDLSNEEILNLCNDIIYYPQLTFILESTQNILILDGKVPKVIINYSQSKKILFEKIANFYPDIVNVSKNPVLMTNLKLFQVKHHILSSVPYSDVKSIFNTIRQSEDFNEIYNEISKNEKLKDEIYNIYTK